jgi:hypothetical protein
MIYRLGKLGEISFTVVFVRYQPLDFPFLLPVSTLGICFEQLEF